MHTVFLIRFFYYIENVIENKCCQSTKRSSNGDPPPKSSTSGHHWRPLSLKWIGNMVSYSYGLCFEQVDTLIKTSNNKGCKIGVVKCYTFCNS